MNKSLFLIFSFLALTVFVLLNFLIAKHLSASFRRFMKEEVEGAHATQAVLLSDLIRNDLLAGNLKEARLKLLRSAVRSSIISIEYENFEGVREELFEHPKGKGRFVNEISVPIEYSSGYSPHASLYFKIDQSTIQHAVGKLNKRMTTGLILTTSVVAGLVLFLLFFLLRSSLFLESYLDRLLQSQHTTVGVLSKFWQPMLNKFRAITDRHNAVNLLINQIERENVDSTELHQMMHDLNSPLTAIKMGIAKLPMSDGPTSLILSGADRMEKLISQAIAKKKKGNLGLITRIVDLALDQALLRLLPILKAQDDKAIVSLSIEPKNSVFSAVDPDAFDRIICNLVRNSIEASANSAEIQLVLKSTEKFNYVIVADRGRGMPPELVANLGRIPISENKFSLASGGSGQGLYNTYSLIRSWGGEIRISSKVDYGTQIAIALPVSQGVN